MANFTNYQDSKSAMLILETQQRDVSAKPAPATANGDGSVGEPPSPLINIGGGGSRFHQHLPPSKHPHSHHHVQSSQPKEQQQHPLSHHNQTAQQQQHLSGENIAESPARKASSSSSGQVHEDSAAATTSHAYTVPVSVASTSDVVDDIRKCGYLRKQKHGHKRFFVLRASSHLGPSRLEYYDSEKKFRNCLRSAAAAAASGAVAPSPPKRVIYLYQCFTVNKRADSKNKHLIALYTKDEYFAIVAENEQEQEDWYVAVSELMNEGKKGHLDSDDLDDGYGTVTPGTVFKEVWQVNVKPKGLGQTKNLTGVYRLCLSTKTIHLVKLNSETPCVNLQLMNIRRCGHSESFFFIEVGRSSSIGPGEIWMQVDDSVVAQNMHETILETMKALKAFVEFRPRSKSQSSGSNPIAFITTRRHLGNLPPSQTGLQRRSRTESVAGTPPSSKSSGASGYRFRTSSEGEGTMSRPFRSVTGSLVHLNAARMNLGRQEGGATCSGGVGGVAGGGGVAGNASGAGMGGGRYARALPSASVLHARSASLPVAHYPSTSSPVSVSSSSGHGSVSDTLTRPSSASICGSPSDGGFNSSDEYGSSPGDFRYFRVRSNTPDSLGNTPPIREESCLSDYMAMGWHREVFGAGGGGAGDEGTSTAVENDERCPSSGSSSSLRRRTHSFSRQAAGGGASAGGVAVYQKMTQTTFSLDDSAATTTGEVVGGLAFLGGSLRGGPPSSSSSSLRSDYSSCSEHSQQSRPPNASSSSPPSPSSCSAAKEDSGYMPMLCGVASAPSPPRDTPPDYMPMQPGAYPHHPLVHSLSPQLHSSSSGSSSARPTQSSTAAAADSHGYMMMLPGGGGAGGGSSFSSSSSPLQASPLSARGSGVSPAGGGGTDRSENGEYMDMSYSNAGGGSSSPGVCKPPAEGGYYALSTSEGPAKSHSPYFSLPRSYKAPAPAREREEYGEYVPMRSPAKPVYSSVAPGSTPERRAPSHPPPPYSAQHATASDRRAVRPTRLPLGRRSFQGLLQSGEPATGASVPASNAPEAPSSPGEYINIEFGDGYHHHHHHQIQKSQTPAAQDGAPSLCSGDHRRSPPQLQPHQDYMSVDVGGHDAGRAKSQSPRPSLVAPWNPPSYIRPLASSGGALASSGAGSGGGGGGHWKSAADDYTDMTFNLGGGEGSRGSPTAVLHHLCVLEGRYGQPPPLPPSSSSSVALSSPGLDLLPQPQTEPKVVRADPQGRRRHSSETFSSTSSSTSTSSRSGQPGAPGVPPSSSSGSPATGHRLSANGAHPGETPATRWSTSGSFDSVWMCVDGVGGGWDASAHHAQSRGPDLGLSPTASASGAGGSRVCRNLSPGYQNGLNYIALELREEVATGNGVASGNGVATGNGTAVTSNGTVPLPENGAYASIDFSKSDGVTATTKD